ncbi:YtxH domain-containing protein [Sporosarcina sp. FSL K6-1522]|uniref:YtxH domain-containing protein n=1 Tax=Sporosarcina sp. FSL K6-1522 TaxID=2921554 RepID=UPI003159FF7D
MNEERNRNGQYENTYGEQTYLPANYNPTPKSYTDEFYREVQGSGASSFLFGALVGGVIGAATALFLAPKTGSEMRGNLTTQASQLKNKSIEISSVAKEKATEFSTVAKEKTTEFTSVAKEKTGELTKTLQEQSGQIIDKVKTMTSKTSVPMDDGTVSSEGEEAIEFINEVAEKVEDVLEQEVEEVTATAEALHKAVEEKINEEATVNEK